MWICGGEGLLGKCLFSGTEIMSVRLIAFWPVNGVCTVSVHPKVVDGLVLCFVFVTHQTGDIAPPNTLLGQVLVSVLLAGRNTYCYLFLLFVFFL